MVQHWAIPRPGVDGMAFRRPGWRVVDTLPSMPVRATKRGEERTPLDGRYDVLICGASFAGLAVARELAGSGAES